MELIIIKYYKPTTQWINKGCHFYFCDNFWENRCQF